MKSGFLANFGYRCRILKVKKRNITRISLGIHFRGLEKSKKYKKYKTRPRIPWYVGPPKVGTLPDTPNMLSFAPRKTGCSALLHLTEWLSLAHFGSLWLSQAHSSSLWLTLTLSGSLWLYSWSWFFLLTGRWTDGRRWSTRSSRT